MADADFFDKAFSALTGHKQPLGWQRRLYRRLADGDPPKVCDLPTGLGKTAVIPIWLIALAHAPAKVPRRLVYMVNRRTVVDQATREAQVLRDNFGKPELADLAKCLRKRLCCDG